MANHNKLGKERRQKKIATRLFTKKGYSIRHCNLESQQFGIGHCCRNKRLSSYRRNKTRNYKNILSTQRRYQQWKNKTIVHATEEYIYLFNIKKKFV